MCSFNNVHNLLKIKVPEWERNIGVKSLDYSRSKTFANLLDRIKNLKSNVISDKYSDELILLNKFHKELVEIKKTRNNLAHERSSTTYFSIPSDEAIKRLDIIYNSLEKPLKLRDYLQKFKNSEEKLTFFNNDQSIGEVLRVIEEKEYTYFPIVSQEENTIRILTGHTIAIYLTKQLENDSFEDIKKKKITDVLEQEENPNKYIVCKQNDYLYKLRQVLQAPDSPLIVLISPETKPSGEDLEAILTPWDYPSIYEFLNK